jgi:hypothetical protein
MKTILLFSIIYLGLFFTACNENKLEIKSVNCKAFTDLYLFNYDSLKSDPINVISMEVVDDCLQMKVSYGGCTTDHPINLAYMHPWCGTPPLPPPTFEIKHDSRGELCKMLVTNNLSFDLTSLRMNNVNEVTFSVYWHTDNENISSKDFIYNY